MFVCTRNTDALARQAFGKSDVAILRFESILEALKLDPAISKPRKDAYIVCNDDIKASKAAKEFLDAAAAKHPDTRIIYVCKTGKCDFAEGNGVDAILFKPKPADLREKGYSFSSSIESKAAVVSSADRASSVIPEYKPPVVTPTEVAKEELPAPNPEPIVESPVVVENFDLPIPEAKQVNDMTNRIAQCGKVAEVSQLAKEITTAEMLKKLAANNAEYSAIEGKLRALKEKIYSVMINSEGIPMEEKMEKIRALIYDRDYYKARNNTIIEQYIEEIIDTLTVKTTELVEARVKELNDAIIKAKSKPGELINYGRLAGITDERANIVLELAVLQEEVQGIMLTASELTDKAAASMAYSEADLTGNDGINAAIKSVETSIISDESLNAIIKTLETYERNSPEFKKALVSLSAMHTKLNKLFDLDKETIAAQNEVLRYLQANRVEDTVVATRLLKRSMRVFLGADGTGRTVTSAVLSTLKSHMNMNVLHVDLTGSSNLSNYNIHGISLDDYLAANPEQELCFVEGHIDETDVNTAQRLLVALNKSADFYRVINIIMTPEQKSLFGIIVPDVLCVNYIVDTELGNLEYMKKVIEATKTDNVGQRVIINRCAVPLRTVVDILDVGMRIDINVVSVPYIPQLISCSLSKCNPSSINAVIDGFSEVTKYA